MADAKIVLSAEDKTRAAFESAKQGLAQVGSLASAAGISLAALGSTVTLAGLATMVKNIAQGIDAMNDLKDATGASIENISALESIARRTGGNFETVSTSLIKFNQALGQTLKPGSDAERVIKAIGLNAKELRDLDPAEALLKTAVALNGFADDGNKARAVQELFGKSLKEVAPLLKDLAEAGQLNATVTTQQAEEAEKFNKELSKMSASMTDISRDVAGPFITRMNEIIERFRVGKKEGEGFLETFVKLGASQRVELQGLVGLSKFMSLGTNLMFPQKPAAKRNEPFESGFVGSSVSLQLPDEPATKATKATKQLTEAEKELADHVAWRRKQYLEAYDAEQKAAAAELKSIEEINKAYLEMQQLRRDGDRAALVSIEQRIADLDREERQYGMLESQIVAVTRAQLEQAREGMYLAGEDIEAVNQRIDAYKRLEAKLQGRELREANERGAREASTAWSQVGDAFVDNLMRGGKSVAQYLKDLFRTLVLRPILQPIGSAVAGAVGSMFPGVASAGGGSGLGAGGNPIGDAAGLGYIMNAGGMTGMGSFLGAGAAATLQNGLISGFGANMANIGTLISGGAYGTALSAALPYLGPVLMAASLLKGAFKGETRSGGKYTGTGFIEGPSGGEIGGEQVRAAISATTSSIDATLAALGSNARLGALESGLESSERGKGFAYAGGALSDGTTFGQRHGDGWQNRRGSMTPEQASAAYAEELKQATLQALQAADVPGILGDYLRQLGDVDKLTGGALDAALGRINKALGEKKQLEATLFELTATGLEKLNKAREAERASIDESNRLLLEELYAQQDLLAARGNLMQAYEREAGGLQSAIDGHRAYARELRDFRDGLLLGGQSPLNVHGKKGEAERQWRATLAGARSGDAAARSAVTGASSAYLTAALEATGSKAEYDAIFARVSASLTLAAASADSQATIGEQQLGVMENQLNALGMLNENVLSFADAFAAFTGAQAALEAAKLARSAPQAAAAPPPPGLLSTVTEAVQTMTGGRNIPELFSSIFGAGPAAEEHWRTWGSWEPPQYASGGDFAGGVRLVGERGPELEVTGPARIFSASQTREILRGAGNNSDATADELRQLRAQVAQLLEAVRASAQHSYRSAKLLDQLHVRGVQIRDREDQTTPTFQIAA